MLTNDTLVAALLAVLDPDTGKPLAPSPRAIKDLTVSPAGDVSCRVDTGYPVRTRADELARLLEDALRAAGAQGALSVTLNGEVSPHIVQAGLARLPNIKNIIVIASGKGGVGKSTTTVNLALALAADGARVGVLDADIYGPSQSLMMGVSGRPESHDGKTMEPLQNYGVEVNSIGFLVKPDDAMIWRGPMAVQALEQLLRQTNWHDLDYLVIDMPPGTGDVHLTLSQKVPVTGAVIVTTPQDIALLDARKGVSMFEKVQVPILGIVENMAVHTCAQCGHTEHIFGAGGGEKMASDFNLPYLGALPLHIDIRQQADSGRPTVVADPDGDIARQYKRLARQVAAAVRDRPRDHSSKLASISIKRES